MPRHTKAPQGLPRLSLQRCFALGLLIPRERPCFCTVVGEQGNCGCAFFEQLTVELFALYTLNLRIQSAPTSSLVQIDSPLWLSALCFEQLAMHFSTVQVTVFVQWLHTVDARQTWPSCHSKGSACVTSQFPSGAELPTTKKACPKWHSLTSTNSTCCVPADTSEAGACERIQNREWKDRIEKGSAKQQVNCWTSR